MSPLFTVIFDDKTTFIGGDYEKTKWTELPEKKIRTLFYLLPAGDYLCLSGYEKYYTYIEAIKDVNGKNANKVQIEACYILGKMLYTTKIYKTDMQTKTLSVSVVANDDVQILKLNPLGWK